MLPQPKKLFSFFDFISDKKNFVLLVVLVALHAGFFLYAYYSKHIYLAVDSTEYLNQAKNFAQHNSWYAGDWNKPHDADKHLLQAGRQRHLCHPMHKV